MSGAFDLLYLAISAKFIRLREGMAIFLPVESGEILTICVPFFVLATLQSALVLILIVMLEEMLHEFVILHRLLTLVQFCTFSRFTDKPTIFQGSDYMLDIFTESCLKHCSAIQASFLVIFIEHSSAGFAAGNFTLSTE